MQATMTYTFFVLLRATPAWLALTRPQRRAVTAEHLEPLLTRSPELRVRHFDAEAFSAVCSDVMLIETRDPAHHYFFMERLRDSLFLTVPYFELVHIVPAIEDGFKAFEGADGGGQETSS